MPSLSTATQAPAEPRPGTLAAHWRRFADVLTGSSPELRMHRHKEAEELRAREERTRVLIEELHAFHKRYERKIEAHDGVSGGAYAVLFDIKNFVQHPEEVDRKKLEKDCVEQLKHIEDTRDDWRNFLSEVMAYSKTNLRKQGTHDLIMDSVRLCDGISKREIAMNEFRKGYVNTARAAGILPPEDDTKTMAPVKIRQPLKLKMKPGG